jgi:hypothetical protein
MEVKGTPCRRAFPGLVDYSDKNMNVAIFNIAADKLSYLSHFVAQGHGGK